jgi:preprotein translocase subunit SecE
LFPKRELSTEKSDALNAFFQELLHVGIYKRNQGRITRQVTGAASALVVVAGCYRFSQFYRQPPGLVSRWLPVLAEPSTWLVIRVAIPSILAIVCLWVSYRLVNVPRFADFLIAVEAEMNKVSWPTRSELFRSSVVVLVCIIALAIVLALYDAVWFYLFKTLKIL